MPTLLVIDDDRAICAIVEAAFKNAPGFNLYTATKSSAGLKHFIENRPDVLLLDINLPEMNGFELYHKVIAFDSQVPVIFITSDSSSETIIHAMRMGAFDYLHKPLRIDQLRKMVSSAVRARMAAGQPVALAVGNESTGDVFVGSSEGMLDVFKAIGRVANQKLPVLIRGESGSGKELVARALVHHGNRTNKPYVSLNCAAIPETLLESELFGHEKGAFTGADKRRTGRFEQCHGGTIFLDEIGDMPLSFQEKILRLLQEQTFERVGGSETIRTDVRVIAATHQPLEKMVAEGKFRQDLFFRLDGFTIRLPALRERRSDIPALTEYFLRKARIDMDRNDLLGVAQDALQELEAHDWPGNVRELQSVVRQSLLHCTTSVITRECLPESVRQNCLNTQLFNRQAPTDGQSSSVNAGRHLSNSEPLTTKTNVANGAGDSERTPVLSVDQFIRERFDKGSNNLYAELIAEVERRLLLQILTMTQGNQSRAAEVLGITRGKIRNRINAFGIKLDTSVKT